MPAPATSVTVNQLLIDALMEIRMGRAGDSLEPELLEWARGKMNRLLDKWNADPAATFDVGFNTYALVALQQDYTLGPSAANWAIAAGTRPEAITAANLILTTSTPNVRVPLNVRDDQWWAANAVQDLTSAVPTDIYYTPSFPNGIVTVWPTPTTATNTIELIAPALLSQYNMTDSLWLPPGYREAITLTLAELCAPGCGQEPSQTLSKFAADARIVVFGNNVTSRNIRTRDAGMPGGGNRGGYSYRTGRIQ